MLRVLIYRVFVVSIALWSVSSVVSSEEVNRKSFRGFVVIGMIALFVNQGHILAEIARSSKERDWVVGLMVEISPGA